VGGISAVAVGVEDAMVTGGSVGVDVGSPGSGVEVGVAGGPVGLAVAVGGVGVKVPGVSSVSGVKVRVRVRVEVMVRV
jgi:hypothetical protein